MKLAFWGLFVLGFIGCTMWGIGPVLQRAGGNWLSPHMLIGCVLGAALVALGVAFATGYRPALLPTDASMVIVLGVLTAAKVAVAANQVFHAGVARG